LCSSALMLLSFFFFTETATTEIYTLSLHDALPISAIEVAFSIGMMIGGGVIASWGGFKNKIKTQSVAGLIMALCTIALGIVPLRSEEHTSELQSRENLVCRLLLEKKKKKNREDIVK